MWQEANDRLKFSVRRTGDGLNALNRYPHPAGSLFDGLSNKGLGGPTESRDGNNPNEEMVGRILHDLRFANREACLKDRIKSAYRAPIGSNDRVVTSPLD